MKARIPNLAESQKSSGVQITGGLYLTYCTVDCCVAISPQIQHLKTIHICYLTVSVGQESKHSLAEYSASGALTRQQSGS